DYHCSSYAGSNTLLF
nr:immunoglobulin light chain junction region [Macaca mulatta]